MRDFEDQCWNSVMEQQPIVRRLRGPEIELTTAIGLARIDALGPHFCDEPQRCGFGVGTGNDGFHGRTRTPQNDEHLSHRMLAPDGNDDTDLSPRRGADD